MASWPAASGGGWTEYGAGPAFVAGAGRHACLALTLAIGSAFTNGLARFLPGPYHVPLYLHLPKLVPLSLLVFWLVRVRLTRWYRRAAAA